MTSTQSLTQRSRHGTPRRVTRYLPLAAALLAAASCTILEPAPRPAGAQAMHPPPEFELWWEKTEACSGLQGDYTRISWYVVPAAASFQTDVGEVVGLWTRSSDGSEITLAGNYMDSELVVRHEMLHDLLGRQGHPPYYFVELCGLTWASWHGDSTSTSSTASNGI